MTDWQLTATTIYCDAVDDEVTFIVQRDWSSRCVHSEKYYRPDRDTARRLAARQQALGRMLACEGSECHRLTSYIEKLQVEEKASKTDAAGSVRESAD